MSLQCPSNRDLIDGLCYTKCPPNFDVQTIDFMVCVSTAACPYSITTQDPVDNGLCEKVAFPLVDGTCSEGYTQWLQGQCYANCPAGYIENGLSCAKRSLDRSTSYPSCGSTWYTYDNGACVLSTGSTVLILVIALITTLVFLFVLYMLMRMIEKPTVALHKH